LLVEVILVNWKRATDTCVCVDSLLKIKSQNIYIVVCDNCSPDGSGDQLQTFFERQFKFKIRHESGHVKVIDYYRDSDALDNVLPIATLVLNDENSGFAKGNNVGLSYGAKSLSPDFYWFLNNDTEVESDTLNEMIVRMQGGDRIGICGSTLVYDFDRETIQAYGGAEYQKWTGAVREIGNQTQLGFPIDQQSVEKRMSYVSGASMLVSKEFLETVGPLSEDYFLYYEEIDWAVRARKKGFRLGYAPDAIVYHKEGAALGSGKSEGRSLLAEYYGVRNRLVFTRKFYPWALPSVFCFSLLQVLRRCLQGRWGHARLMAAVLFGLRKVPPR